jgi:hypothetical protein
MAYWRIDYYSWNEKKGGISCQYLRLIIQVRLKIEIAIPRMKILTRYNIVSSFSILSALSLDARQALI